MDALNLCEEWRQRVIRLKLYHERLLMYPYHASSPKGYRRYGLLSFGNKSQH